MKNRFIFISIVLGFLVSCKKEEAPKKAYVLPDFETVLKAHSWYMAQWGTKYDTYDPDANVPLDIHFDPCDTAILYNYHADSSLTYTFLNDSCAYYEPGNWKWIYHRDDAFLSMSYYENGRLLMGYGYIVKDYTEDEIHFYITGHAIEDTTYYVDLVTFRAKN